MRLAGLAALFGCAYLWWLRAPVIDTVGVQVWRAAGLVAAASLGGIGALVTRSWIRASVAATIGFLTGAAWAESRLSDVNVGFLDSAITGVVNQGRLFLLPGIAAAVAGGFLIYIVSGTAAT